MNYKSNGERGERIAIGELAKYYIDVAIPLTDNLPFDFIVIKNGKLYKVQVKSYKKGEEVTPFDLSTSNWYSKTIKKYSKQDIDVMILCDYENIFLLGSEDFDNKSSFSIRYKYPENGQRKKIHLAEDYIISQKRIDTIFD